jgi:hypothetical protein
MCLLHIFAKFASDWLLAGCKFHSVSRQPDANFIQLAAIRMHILFSRRQPDGNCIWQAAMQYKIPSLRAASNLPNEICILLAASTCKLCRKKQLVHC